MHRFSYLVVLSLAVALSTTPCSAQSDPKLAIGELSEQVAELLANEKAQQALDLLSGVPVDELNDVLHRQRGAAFDSLGQTANARKEFDSAVAKGPQTSSNYLVRAYHLANRSAKEALPDFRKAVELDESNADAQADFGAVLAMLRRYNDAEPHLRRALQIAPDDESCLTNLAEVLRNTDRAKEAFQMTERAVKANGQFRRAYFVQGLVLQSLRDPARAAESYSAAIKIQPTDVQSHYNRGNCYYDLDEYDLARQDYLFCLKQNYKDDDALVSLAFTEYYADEQTQAIEYATKATQIAPDNPEAWGILGQCLGDTGEYKKAYDAVTKEIELQPNGFDGYAKRTWYCQQLGDFDQGLSDALAALKITPDSNSAHYNAGICSHKLKKWDAAAKHFTAWLESEGETSDDEVWRLRSECYTKLGNQKAATADLAIANKINVPLDEKNLTLLQAISNQQADVFIKQLAPAIRPLIDDSAIKDRLRRIESEFPYSDEQMRRVVQADPEHGRLATTIVFRSDSGEEADEVTMVVHRDKDDALLGIELRGPDWKCGTRDALKSTKSLKSLADATKQSERLFTGILGGDLQDVLDTVPDFNKKAMTQLTNTTHSVFGDVKAYWLQDVVISDPTKTRGLPSISVFGLIEGKQESFVPSEARFALTSKLELTDIQFGDKSQASYLTQNPQFATRFAKVVSTGKLDDFAGLWFEVDQEAAADELTGVYLAVLKRTVGDFVQVRPASVSSQVAIDDGVFRRMSTFSIEFQNLILPVSTTEQFGKLIKFNADNDQAGFDWIDSTELRDHWQPKALSDLKVYLSGTPDEVMSLLKQYGGFDSVTKEQIAGGQSSFTQSLGEIKKITPTRSSCADYKWTFEFDIEAANSNGHGSVIYSQSGFERKLQNFSVTPIKQ